MKILLAYVATKDYLSRLEAALSMDPPSLGSYGGLERLLVTDVFHAEWDKKGHPQVARDLSSGGVFSLSIARNLAQEYALAGGFDWLMHLDADSTAVVWPESFEAIAPASGFGSVRLINYQRDRDGRVIHGKKAYGSWFLIHRRWLHRKWCEQFRGPFWSDVDFSDVVMHDVECQRVPAIEFLHQEHEVHPYGMGQAFEDARNLYLQRHAAAGLTSPALETGVRE